MLLKSRPGREAEFAKWQDQFVAEVNAEIDRRHLVPLEAFSNAHITRPQVARVDAAGWNVTDPGSECMRRTRPIEVEHPTPGADFVETEVYAREIAWRFGDGEQPLSIGAARKLAAIVHLERQGETYDEHDALQRFFEYERWRVLQLFPSALRAERVEVALRVIGDPEVALRDRGVPREELLHITVEKWRASCALSQALHGELSRRPHLDLDDDRLARMSRLLVGHFGHERIATEVQARTPRGLLSFLMSVSCDERDPEQPLVVRTGRGPVVHSLHFNEALERAFGQVAPPEQAPQARPAARKPLDYSARLKREVVLTYRELLDANEDLDDFDKVMLTVQALERMTERWIIVPEVVGQDMIPKRGFRRPVLIALEGVAKTFDFSPTEWFGGFRRLCRDFAAWSCEMVELCGRAAEGVELSEQDRLRLSWYLNSRSKIGPVRDFDQFGEAVREGLAELGIEITPNDRIAEILGKYKELLREEAARSGKPESSGLFLGTDGRLKLSSRLLRDAYGKAYRLRRLRDESDRDDIGAVPDKYSEALDQPTTVPVIDGLDADEEAQDALDAFQGVDLVGRVREFARQRCEEAKPGSARAIVSEDLCRFPQQASLRDLSRQHGKAVGGLSKARKRLFAELRAEFGNSLGM